MHKMKVIFLVGYMLLTVFSSFALATGSSRWRMLADGSIEWVPAKQIPHSDHIEMSGKQVSVVLRYGVNADGAFVVNKSMVWPLLRTIPNNTHASLMRRFDWNPLDMVTVNGRTITDEKVDNIRLKGMLTVESSYNGGWYGQCKVIREYLPSTDLPALIENYLLINTDKNPMFVEIPVINNRLYTDPRKGVDGSYLIEMKIDRNGYFSIQPGDTLSFSAYITGYKKGQPALVINGQQEKLKRIEAVTSWMDNLVLETPDPIIDRMFAFSKIRACESIYETQGGPMHGPGGESYYAAIWANDQAEYINPYFPFTRSDVTNIVTIDIGGGTTDIVVADTNGVKCISSMRFAADAIFGNSLVSVQNGELNGIIRQCKDDFISKLEGEEELQKMLIQKTANNYGNSSEVASFLFSLADNEKIKAKSMSDAVDFNAYLMRNGSQKIVFFIFYTSIIYHLAHLMKAKRLEVPANIAFSGNGSKVVSVLSPNKSSLEKLTRHIFKLVYDSDIDKDIKLILNSENPKEATCKGGLFLSHEPTNIESAKSILLGVSRNLLCESETYADAQTMYDDVVKDVRAYFNFIALKLARIQGFSLSNEFGIDKQHLDLAAKCFNENLSTYVEKGVRLKLDTSDVSLDDKLEETLFFYPIIGVINDLSNRICENE